MRNKQQEILETLTEIKNQLAEMNMFLDTLNSNQAQTDVKVTDIKIYLMNNGE